MMSEHKKTNKVSFTRHIKDAHIANFISENFKVGDNLPGKTITSYLVGHSVQAYRDFILVMAAKGVFKLSQGMPVTVIKDPLDCEEHW